MEPVIVVWRDAWELAGDHAAKDVVLHKEPERRSIGFVLLHDDTRIMLTGTDDRGWPHSDTDCNYVNAIPIGMIQQIIPLRPTG